MSGQDSHALAYGTALAATLGDGWTAADDSGLWGSGSALLTGPDELRVSVRLGDASSYPVANERGRVRFVALVPDGLYQHGSRNTCRDITVAATKPAATVAKELERRLLADYRDWIVQARAAQRHHDAREAERAALVDAAAVALAPLGEVTVWDRNDRHYGDPSGKLSVGRHGDPVQIELEVTRSYSPASLLTPEARATLRVHRDLLPRLTAALATLATTQP